MFSTKWLTIFIGHHRDYEYIPTHFGVSTHPQLHEKFQLTDLFLRYFKARADVYLKYFTTSFLVGIVILVIVVVVVFVTTDVNYYWLYCLNNRERVHSIVSFSSYLCCCVSLFFSYMSLMRVCVCFFSVSLLEQNCSFVFDFELKTSKLFTKQQIKKKGKRKKEAYRKCMPVWQTNLIKSAINVQKRCRNSLTHFSYYRATFKQHQFVLFAVTVLRLLLLFFLVLCCMMPAVPIGYTYIIYMYNV